ncbi:hypothetical protein R75483_06316 [Paraburkholderia domus]|nr:hypothetical protein R75483_06316 [Paraburkholderia domus]
MPAVAAGSLCAKDMPDGPDKPAWNVSPVTPDASHIPAGHDSNRQNECLSKTRYHPQCEDGLTETQCAGRRRHSTKGRI